MPGRTRKADAEPEDATMDDAPPSAQVEAPEDLESKVEEDGENGEEEQEEEEAPEPQRVRIVRAQPSSARE